MLKEHFLTRARVLSKRHYLWVFLPLACIALGLLGAQAPVESVGRIAGEDIYIKGALSVEVENGRTTTVLASGSDITVKSGQARLMLTGGGEIGVCGPAHFSLLRSGGAITLALDFGRLRLRLENSGPLTIYSPLIVATPISIAGEPRDATVGLEANSAMCVRAGQGAVRIEQQLSDQVLLVPQSGEVAFSEGQLDSVRSGAVGCYCDVLLAKTKLLEGPMPPELSVPVSPDADGTAKSPNTAKNNQQETQQNPAAPATEQPIYKVMMPALSFDATSPTPPPGPSSETMLLVREARVRPEVIFQGRVEGSPSPSEQATNPSSPSGNLPTKRSGFFARLKKFFLPPRPPCDGASCANGTG